MTWLALIIGLSLHKNSEAPKEHARNVEADWLQDYLGEWSDSPVPGKHGVRGVPSIFLIGPDGGILARGLRGERILQTVRKHLPNEE